MKNLKEKFLCCLYSTTALALVTAASAGDEKTPPSAVAPQQTQKNAIEIMKKACGAYVGMNSVQIKGMVSVDKLNDNDLKIQDNFVVYLDVESPDKVRIRTEGDENTAVFFDGHMISVVDYRSKFYSQKPLVGNLKAFLDATDELNIPTPMLDFLVHESCIKSTETADSASVLDDLNIGGVKTQHLLFENNKNGLAWQVWINEKQERPHIVKVVITSRHIPHAPQYQFVLIEEKLEAVLSDKEFDFRPAPDFIKVDLLPVLEERIKAGKKDSEMKEGK